MSVDILSVVVRALSFVALFQAVGIVLFMALFAHLLSSAEASIRRSGLISAWLGCLLVATHQLLAAARMTGEFSGVLDCSMQWRALANNAAAANVLQVVGLLLMAATMSRQSAGAKLAGMIAAAVVTASFIVTGHTSIHPQRWFLAPLLLSHLWVVAFWFGSVAALYQVSAQETTHMAAEVIARFSAIATWLVPGIAIAGVLMAVALLPSFSVLLAPYGLLLLVKVIGFALLMGLAALNKWHFGPALASGDAQAARALCHSLAIEYVLICGVLAATAVMTGLFSPEPQ